MLFFFNFPLTEVTSQLFLGSSNDAANETELQDNGITHVVSLIGRGQVFVQGIKYAHAFMKGNGKTELKEILTKLWPIIEESQEKDKALFIYCLNGQNISAAVMLAILMKSKGKKLSKAYKLLKSKRPIVSINEWYAKQLVKMEKELFDKNSVCAHIHWIEEGSCSRNTRKAVIPYDRVSSTMSTCPTKSGTPEYSWSSTTGAIRFSVAPHITCGEFKEKS